MAIFDATAVEALREKCDYELWLLNYLAETQSMIEGSTGLSPKITLTAGGSPAPIQISLGEIIGGGTAIGVIANIAPLTFTASYKILDMAFEWILEENGHAVPWRFSDKIKSIGSTSLRMPPVFETAPFLHNYAFAFYSKLLKFRNEVVHKHNFSLKGDILEIRVVDGGRVLVLSLSKHQLTAFVKVVVAMMSLLLGTLAFGKKEQAFIEYHLDQIPQLHGLAAFGRAMPRMATAEAEVPVIGGYVSVDLEWVRREVAQRLPGGEVLFDLIVRGRQEGQPDVVWHFPDDKVPRRDSFSIGLNDYPEQRVRGKRAGPTGEYVSALPPHRPLPT